MGFFPNYGKGGEKLMAIFTIIRIYEVPAETRQQATERMLEALMFHVEKDFHVKDIIREPREVAAALKTARADIVPLLVRRSGYDFWVALRRR